MSLRILIVPDKFKGTLTARAAADLMAQGWLQSRPTDQVHLLPMSDGGDGFGDVLSQLLDFQAQTTHTVDAAHRPREGRWWWNPQSRTALIESAQVIGLAHLPPGKYHPFELDTFGLSAVIRSAVEMGAQKCLIGIGGSATNDGGFGMAKGLNWTFLNEDGKSIEKWTDLSSLASIVPPKQAAFSTEFIVAVDVQNPLLGPSGASRVYGPQKGLKPEDMPRAEAALERLSKKVEERLMRPVAVEPGTGAAGGLGFGLASFLGAKLQSGFDIFAQYARLEEHIRSSDLVITGEGAIDASTLMGKGVGEIATLCQKHRVPCIGLAGTLIANGDIQENRRFARTYGIAPQLTSPEDAKQNPFLWLPRLAAEAARSWNSSPRHP